MLTILLLSTGIRMLLRSVIKKKTEVAYEKREERLVFADGIYYMGGVDRRLRKMARK